MKKICDKIRCLCLALVLTVTIMPFSVYAGSGDSTNEGAKDSTKSDSDEITVLFTHDSHDYLYPTTTLKNGEYVEHGGAARLATLIKENAGDSTIYLDGGDFSMGTLYQAAYATEAYELRNLGIVGCSVTTLGNHEFDYGEEGLTKMLRAARASGDPLPKIVQANMNLSGELTEAQKELQAAMDEYGVVPYTIEEVGGYRIGILGIMGYDSIECTQADVSFDDYIDTARNIVSEIEAEGVDVIVALSHSGTNGDGTGEDIDLAKAVPNIDLIISAHSHTKYEEPVMVGDTAVVSCGEYLEYLGKVSFSVDEGRIDITDYELLPIDSSVKDDKDTAKRFKTYKKQIENDYLKTEGVTFDQVICHSDYSFIDLTEMYSTHQEYNMGDLIADSYLYEAKQNDIDDIDVALVGLGTIRGSIKQGYITVKDVFEICSLGVGSDGTAGHPIVYAYITGKELKLLTELDASLGPLVSSVKMSYSGLSYTFDTKRIILDRVTDVHLVKSNGKSEEIDDERLYKVAANMYAVNMLGMLNGLTKGILSITPKDENGEAIDNFYDFALKDKKGNEIKEWVCLKDYLMSFDEGQYGKPEIPTYYSDYAVNPERKIKTEVGGKTILKDMGTATKIIPRLIKVAAGVLVLLILILIILIKKRKKAKRYIYSDKRKHGRRRR